MKKSVVSVFVVTDYKTGKKEEVTVEGVGQSAISFLRKEYKKRTKFVLDGFEINGTFVPISLRTHNRA